MAIIEQANVLVLRGEVEQAKALLQRARDVDDDNHLPPSIAVMLRSAFGKALLAEGRAAEAAEEFQSASGLQLQIGAEPVDRAEVDFHLARARYDLGEHERALELAERARQTFIEVGPGARLFRGRVESWLAEKRRK
jgi:tetratricopeptide (TPR) repeat protein